jgi:hypothetical protein
MVLLTIVPLYRIPYGSLSDIQQIEGCCDACSSETARRIGGTSFPTSGSKNAASKVKIGKQPKRRLKLRPSVSRLIYLGVKSKVKLSP